MRAAAALALVGFGLWQLGAGGWIHAKAALAQTLLAAAWSRAQSGVDQAPPWPWADTWPVARLRAPRVGADLLVLAGGSGRTLAFGPGHVDGSAAPGGDGMSVIAGHRDTHFRFLRELLPGDRLRLTDRAGTVHSFSVRTRHVVHKDRARLAMDVPGLALVTCYPFDALETGGPLRYVVLAEPLPEEPPVRTMPMTTAAAPAR
jgi:sortase A